MAADLTLKRHDTWPPLKAALEQTNESGGKEAINLTGAIKVKLIMKAGATVVEGTCAIVSAAAGTLEYTWAAGDTATAGTYEVEFEIEWTSTHFQSVPNEGHKTILIETDLGGH